MKNLLVNEYPEYFGTYINKVESEDLIEALEVNLDDFTNFIENIVPDSKYEFRYQPEKWSIKEIVQHIIDAERIFAYRALRMARFDKTPLPGFEENDYVSVSESDKRTMDDLIREFVLVRKSTIELFESFSDEMMKSIGVASGKEVSVRAIGYIISGHCIHHQQVIKERYL
ncbi:DinB family protein [Flavobacterium terrae]|uniref:DinB superfamily protein n=1 Tax=Flavobacterium terrae TaxID=415425 RepID=A0A1M6ECQ3_9FLAO|nr:DinB family protein [Flavobacterium terrae]SHI83090.1 DinB superfamily protein [Flavobacterium terrae]